jgi:hypothetical protein
VGRAPGRASAAQAQRLLDSVVYQVRVDEHLLPARSILERGVHAMAHWRRSGVAGAVDRVDKDPDRLIIA